jgi:hypothetical protein
MNSSLPVFREPTAVEKIFNRVFGFLVGIGAGFPHKYLLQVRGRKSGKLYSTPLQRDKKWRTGNVPALHFSFCVLSVVLAVIQPFEGLRLAIVRGARARAFEGDRV